MAAPVDSVRTTTGVTTAATSTNVNTGTPASGDLALVFGRFAADPSTMTFTGYTILDSAFAAPDSPDASDDWLWVWYRVCNGTEGASDACSWVNSVKAAFIYHRITGHDAPTTPPTGKTGGLWSVGTGANPDPPAITPDPGLGDYLFIAHCGMDSETATPSVAPSGYSNLVTANSGTGGAVATNCIIASASKQATAVTTENPGTFTAAAPNSGWTAMVVAVKAAGVATDRPGQAVPVYNPAQMRAILRSRGR